MAKYAEPIIAELLDFQGPWIAHFEELASSENANHKTRHGARKMLSLLRDYESAETTEMIAAMPDDPPPTRPSPQPKAPKHKKPHPWRSSFKRAHNG